MFGRREVTRKQGLGDVYKRAHEDMQMHAENFFFFFFGQGFSDCEIFSNIGITGIKQSYLCVYIYIYMTSLNVQIDLFKYTKRFIKSASVL